MDFITAFFGRFHPLLVHLPIGILFLAFLFECLSASERYRRLKNAVQPALFWGSMFAIASGLTGYFLRQEGGYEEDIATLHQNFGIATAILCLVVYGVRRKLKRWVIDPIKRKQFRILLFIPLIVLLSVTGHWGGSLTHGEDYLFSAVSVVRTETADPTLKIKAIANIPDAILYRDVIQPIFEARCYDCHSSRKQKGELRLDQEDLIERGGKHGVVIGDGVPDSTSLFKRLMLPLEDEHHMPPGEKPQLSSSEIALIKYWIEEKPFFNKRISDFESGEKITAIIQSLQEAPKQSWIPLESAKAPDEESLQKMKAVGVTPMRLAEGSNYFMVSFTDSRTITDEQINSLLGIKDQLIWLNLSNSSITDKQMERVAKLNNLRVLYLNYTKITDSGLSQLSALSELRMLNLVATQVTDSSVPAFLKFEKLSNLFLYQTSITQEGIEQFTGQRKEVEVDTGNYILKKLPGDTVVYKKVSKNN
jgi:uncharacterized membrane protein